MDYESPLSPYDAIQKAEKYFTEEVLNSVIKEKPTSRQAVQNLEVSVTGGRWDIFWVQVVAFRDSYGTTKINSKSRMGLTQLTFAVIIWLLSVPFLYLGIMNSAYLILALPIFLFVLGFLSILMPIIRMRSTQKSLKEILLLEREIKEKNSRSSLQT